MSAASLINRFGQKHTVRRDTNEESTTKGKRNPDVWREFTITASIQPLRPDEVVDEQLGGERNRHSIRIYTATELHTVRTDGSQLKADRIIYNGEEFEIVQVDLWTLNKRGLQHYKAIGQLVNDRRTK